MKKSWKNHEKNMFVIKKSKKSRMDFDPAVITGSTAGIN